MFVVYDHPADFPSHWVVRHWTVDAGGPVARKARLFDTLEGARDELRGAGLYVMPHEESDEPQVVETWF